MTLPPRTSSISRFCAKSPDDVDLLVAHGQNLIRQQRFSEAMAAFDKATETRFGRR